MFRSKYLNLLLIILTVLIIIKKNNEHFGYIPRRSQVTQRRKYNPWSGSARQG